jgi:hypothetical protein
MFGVLAVMAGGTILPMINFMGSLPTGREAIWLLSVLAGILKMGGLN